MRSLMRPFATILLAVCGMALWPFCGSAAAQEPQVVDGIAAVVNGDVITYSQVRALSAPREKLLRSQYTGGGLEKKMEGVGQAALKKFIDRRPVNPAFQKKR